MKTLNYLPLLGIVTLSSFIIGCDGGNSGDSNDALTGLDQDVVRGLDLADIRANPTGIPGFPFTLSRGETITFTPDIGGTEGFLEESPLGTWTVNSSGFVNVGPTSSVDEAAFLYAYNPGATADSPLTVSTQIEARISYDEPHIISDSPDDRANRFHLPLTQIYSQSSAPGSLREVVDRNSGTLSTSDERTIVRAIRSIGVAAGVHPVLGGMQARLNRQILLFDIDSTNLDIARPNPFITGSYEIVDTWAEVEIFAPGIDEGHVNLEHNNTSTVTDVEIETGTFRIELDDFLTQTD